MKTILFITMLLVANTAMARFVTVCPLDGSPCQTVIVWDAHYSL